MATWTDLCYVRQTVCDKIGEEFYNEYGEEITNFFQDEKDEIITESNIFAYCLGIVVKNKIDVAYNFKDDFFNFVTIYLDSIYQVGVNNEVSN